MPLDAKTLNHQSEIHEKFRSAAATEGEIRGTESLCSDTLPGRGSAPGAISIDLHHHLHHHCWFPWWGGSSSLSRLRVLPVAMCSSLSLYAWSYCDHELCNQVDLPCYSSALIDLCSPHVCESDSVHTMVALRLEITNTCYELYLELDVFMKLWCLLDSSSTQGDSVGFSRWKRLTLRCAVIALPWIRVSNRRVVQRSIIKKNIFIWECSLVKVWSLGLVSKHWNTVCY